jgi:hypothetical protein
VYARNRGVAGSKLITRFMLLLLGIHLTSETKEIYAELSRLTEKIKAEGYLPHTRLVLRDVDTTKIQHNITQWQKTTTFDVVMKSLQSE